MKYICTNPFPNPVGNPIVIVDIKDDSGKVVRKQSHVKDDAGTELKQHVHKGAIFNIGTASEFKDLAPAEKTLVSHLMVAHKISDATDSTVKRVLDEVEADRKREEKDRARDKVADPMQAIAEVLQKLNDTIASLTSQKKAT